jgi:translation elongation factor Ts
MLNLLSKPLSQNSRLTSLKKKNSTTKKTYHQSSIQSALSADIMEKIKILRKETKAGLSDCRDAIVNSDGDLAKAKEWLEGRHDELYEKKKDNATNEGGILMDIEGGKGMIVEMKCETDFAAFENQFLTTLRMVARAVWKSGLEDIGEIMKLKVDSGRNVEEEIKQLCYILRENVRLTKVIWVPSKKVETNKNSKLYCYVHGPAKGDEDNTPRIGKALGLVEIETDDNLSEEQAEKVRVFGRKLSIAVLGTNPVCVTKEQAGTEISKAFYEQRYSFDPKFKVIEVINQFKKESNINKFNVLSFKAMQLKN